MADGDDWQRTLALAKSGLRAPSRARVRVRARLVESGGGAPGSGNDSGAPVPIGSASPRAAAMLSGSAARGTLASSALRAKLERAARLPWRSLACALVGAGVGLYAGYWIGFQRAEASLAALGSTRESSHASAARDDAADHADSRPAVAAPAAAAVPPPQGASSPRGLEPPQAGGEPDERIHRSSAADRADRQGEVVEDRSRGTPATLSESTRQRPSIRRWPRAAPLASGVAVPSSRRAVESDSVDPFAAEVALLQRAERAIRAGEGALALSFLDELERQFPGSSLRVERDAARTLARCQVARTGSAAEREVAWSAALELLSRGPSVYALRVRELCEVSSESTSADGEEVTRRGH
jgi:hypothetical protein